MAGSRERLEGGCVMITEAIFRAVEGRSLGQDEAADVMGQVIDGKATAAQVAALLVAFRMKREAPTEIAGCAKALQAHMRRVPLCGEGVVDTAGTGGDGAGTFNISTVAAFVAAGAGVPVAKHGNRAVSSKSGSADVLEALGVRIELPPEKVSASVREVGFGFIYAPLYHPALSVVSGIRKEIGIRTIFNIVGPLVNPACAKARVLGVYDPRMMEPLAFVLRELGVRRALLVHGKEGIDEIGLTDTFVVELNGEKVLRYTISAERLGLLRASLRDLRGGSAQDNAELTVRLLKGEGGPMRDVVLVNAAAAIVAAGGAKDLRDGLEVARESIDSGNALRCLRRTIEFSRDA